MSKKKRTAKQIAATKKMLAARKKQLRKVKSNPRKKAGKKVSKKRTVKKTAIRKKTATRKKTAARKSRDRRYYVQGQRSKYYWDGLNVNAKTRKTAASFTDKQSAAKVARRLANLMGRAFLVVD